MFFPPEKNKDDTANYRQNFLTENPVYRGHLRPVNIPGTYAEYLAAVIRLANAAGCPLSDYLGNIIAEHILKYQDIIEQMVRDTPKAELPKI